MEGQGDLSKQVSDVGRIFRSYRGANVHFSIRTGLAVFLICQAGVQGL